MQVFPNILSRFVNTDGTIIKPWVQYLQQFTQLPPDILSISVGTSPFSYTAKEPGYVHVNGGVVASISLIRGSVTLVFTGEKAVPVSIGDRVIVVYSVLPTIKFIPIYGAAT